MKKLLLLLPVLFTDSVFAQAPGAYTSSEVYQKIEKLNVLGTVLYVAAHPDDENTGLIAYLGNDRLYRTGYLAMTRGDGGQNLIGNEQGVALGLIRTQELLAARRIDGGEQFFTRAFDFGYSKGPEETFEIWGEEKILSDVVWVIRKFRPDVMIARFPTTGEGGHGHHTASAILASEAFEAAADSTRFPEQLKEGVTIWQPKRLLWNTFNYFGQNTVKAGQFSINVGGYNALLGESYSEMAARSRSQHKSQGFGAFASRGLGTEHFATIKGGKPEKTLFDGVDVSWNRIGHSEIAGMVDNILKNFSFTAPKKSIPQLIALYNKINSLPDGYWKTQKLKEVKQLLVIASGMYINAATTKQFFTPGNNFDFVFSVGNQTGIPLEVKSIKFLDNNFPESKSIPQDSTFNWPLEVRLPKDMPVSQPYWLQQPMTRGTYTVNNQQLIGKPENDPLKVEVTFVFDQTVVPVNVPVKYEFSDPVKGAVYQPVFIIPNVEIQSTPGLALSKNKTPVEVDTHITRNDSLAVIEKIVAQYTTDVVKTADGRYYLNRDNATDMMNFSVNSNGKKFDRYKVMINYPHIPDIVYFPSAQTKLVGVDVKTSGKAAGYIPGAGDKIPEALEQLGYQVTVLTEEDFTKDKLGKFDVIISGVRAYNIHKWLNSVYGMLMDYVKDGGVLFVQYNTSTSIGPLQAKIAPYSFEIARTRVTDEDAEVTFTDVASRLMHFPNEITEKDFRGWIQERSTYHASQFQEHYKTLFSMHDAAEAPDEGSLIYCNFGKGRFVYSGLVFFRELPAGVPGAYRLFSNLIAKPEM